MTYGVTGLCFYHLKVRTSLIPSPPTYNSKYGYLNWESYYNLTYYTRILPPVPEDCPLPMGTKGTSVTDTCSYCGSVVPCQVYVEQMKKFKHVIVESTVEGNYNVDLCPQVKQFFLIPKSWLSGSLREPHFVPTLREPT